MSKKKTKIYCYRLSKPLAKSLNVELRKEPGRIECEGSFIIDQLGVLYLISQKKFKKDDEIKFSNGKTINYKGVQKNSISFEIIDENTPVPESADDISGSLIVYPTKEFFSVIDPKNMYLEQVILSIITDSVFKITEKKTRNSSTEPADSIEQVLEDELISAEIQPALEQVNLDGVIPEYTTDPADMMIDPAPISENESEWYEEPISTTNVYEVLDELQDKVNSLEQENFRLSNKINSTIEEIKNINFFDRLFGKWKSRLLDILQL